MIDFERTRDAVESGLRENLHPGAQLCVSLNGEILIDEAFGAARVGVAMHPDSLTLWFSAGKPITAVAIGQLVEHGSLKWDRRVAEVIPEFARHGKELVTLRHLLTHTVGLRHADDIDSSLSWDEQIARICELPLEENWIPGERAGYHVSGTWQLLGEIVRRVSGKPSDEFARANIFLPLGMRDSWLALSTEEVIRSGERVVFVYDTSAGSAQPKQEWNNEDGLTRCRPGGNVRGPVRELARFYNALLNAGENILQPASVRTMTSRQRAGIFDETFQFKMDWGFGFILNSNRDGFQMPYGYGRHASRETFGHSGNQSSCAFADPRHKLVVAWACNGLPGERKHQQRQRAINNAIYEDLGLESSATV
ncbi:MAG TPA: serine hydrolase domain-containing protein [Verrucomicrobiae bacterium]